ncbi:MAG: LD-carboxypeptidase [Planctomycetaceae bacterium]|nr:LD-carboxypeptidase [Planctomycetaceae bacterium]
MHLRFLNLLVNGLAASLLCVSLARAADDATPPMIAPALLEPGDTIMFVAPAGELDRQRMMLAKQRLEERGYKTKQRDDLFAVDGYLAGSDQRRSEELMQAFLDPEVDAVFPGTGGYGTMRMLDLLDYDAIRAHPKLLIGFSDITALHAAVNRQARLITYHSPNPQWGLGSEEYMEPFTEKYFFAAVEQAAHDKLAGPDGSYAVECDPSAPQPVALGSGKARGRLVGGNLSLVAALEGTPYAIEAEGAILLIEDIREAPYRVDRMLRQLKLSGKLDQIAGAVLGQFTRANDREEDTTDDERYSVDGVLRQYFADAGIPVLMNFPVGHHRYNCALPLGGLVEVDADAGMLRVLANE